MIENEIVTEAIEYILLNTWNNVTLEDVAEHCHMSVSYFSRIFKEQTGESVYAFIKRIKMEQSAMKLKMEKDREITDIGQDYGYSSSNYSTAFSQYHKQSPSEFRNEINKKVIPNQDFLEQVSQKIRIEERPEYTVMYERTIGVYKEMKETWCRFVENHQDEIDEDTIFFERTFDDPMITKADRCLYDICMTTKYPERHKNLCKLEAGKYVVYPFKGYIEEIYNINQVIVGLWFPNSHNLAYQHLLFAC